MPSVRRPGGAGSGGTRSFFWAGCSPGGRLGPQSAAFGARRLHGRLDRQSPVVSPQKSHQPRTFRTRAAAGLSAVLAAGPSI
jgi:hypothetical protein